MKYKVMWDYAARYGERTLAFKAGQVVDLDERTAAWMNRDSPGVVRPHSERAREVVQAPQDRQVKGARRRG